MNQHNNTIILVIALLVLSPGALQANEVAIEPGPPVDYNDIAIYPDRWDALENRPQLFPWAGEEVVFLTTQQDMDREIVARLLNRLDNGWRLYAEMTGRRPSLFKQLEGKPTITAVPTGSLTCGYGCGYVGATGIEVAGFYNHDYSLLKSRPQAMPHYYFYEMGRNFYTFGDRHSLFITGYAVFMRYVCMDALGCEDADGRTRQTIEAAEALFAESDMDFLRGFTNVAGLDEKAPRLKDGQGRWISPSDQPVLYASAMLRLHRDYGGHAWLKRFFRQLGTCPKIKAQNKEAALHQSLNWLVSASCAAQKDLSNVFADRWRMPLDSQARGALATVDWNHAELSAGQIVRAISEGPVSQ